MLLWRHGALVRALLLWALALSLTSRAQDSAPAELRCALSKHRQMRLSCANSPFGATGWAASTSTVAGATSLPVSDFDSVVTPRVALAGLLHACLGGANGMSSVATSQQAPPRPLRVVAPKLALLDSLASRADVFSDTTGVPVSFDLLSFGAFSLRRQSLLLDRSPPNVTHGYDVMIVTPTAYGDAAQVPGKLLDISRLVSGDPSLLDILPAFRAATMYSGGVMAIPLVPAPFLLFYRLDIFQRDNLTVPQTWEQFADLAERYHNGPDGLVGNCNIPVGGTCRGESVFLRALLTSYIQTEGPSHGFLWDPETMQTLVTSEAGETALKMFRRLTAVGPTWSHSPECVQNDFNMGRCFMGVGHPSQFKSGSFGAPGLTRARGKMGIAPHPGTTRVLDRTTLKLVPCDRTRCPLAEEVVMEDGASRLLNRPILLQSTMVMLNGLSPLAFQFYAFQLFALLASASVVGTGRGNGLLLEPNELLPMRLSDVSPDQLKYWVAKGYDPGDAERFLAVYRTTAIKEHIMPEVKIRMASNVTSALNTAAALYNSPATNATALPAILGRLEAALNGIVAAEGGQDAFAQQYRRSLNWVPKTGTGGAASVSPAPDSQHGASSAEVTVALAVAIPCGCAIVLAAAAALYLRRRQQLKARDGGGSSDPFDSAPGVAADTKCLTLVVTDIYESTALWEKLPASVMDAAVSTHHAVIRQALLVHGGVESATEGDSFIISLKAPVAAAAFCLDVQQALLGAPWPVELTQYRDLEDLIGREDGVRSTYGDWLTAAAAASPTATVALVPCGDGRRGAAAAIAGGMIPVVSSNKKRLALSSTLKKLASSTVKMKAAVGDASTYDHSVSGHEDFAHTPTCPPGPLLLPAAPISGSSHTLQQLWPLAPAVSGDASGTCASERTAVRLRGFGLVSQGPSFSHATGPGTAGAPPLQRCASLAAVPGASVHGGSLAGGRAVTDYRIQSPVSSIAATAVTTTGALPAPLQTPPHAARGAWSAARASSDTLTSAFVSVSQPMPAFAAAAASAAAPAARRSSQLPYLQRHLSDGVANVAALDSYPGAPQSCGVIRERTQPLSTILDDDVVAADPVGAPASEGSVRDGEGGLQGPPQELLPQATIVMTAAAAAAGDRYGGMLATDVAHDYLPPAADSFVGPVLTATAARSSSPVIRSADGLNEGGSRPPQVSQSAGAVTGSNRGTGYFRALDLGKAGEDTMAVALADPGPLLVSEEFAGLTAAAGTAERHGAVADTAAQQALLPLADGDDAPETGVAKIAYCVLPRQELPSAASSSAWATESGITGPTLATTVAPSMVTDGTGAPSSIARAPSHPPAQTRPDALPRRVIQVVAGAAGMPFGNRDGAEGLLPPFVRTPAHASRPCEEAAADALSQAAAGARPQGGMLASQPSSVSAAAGTAARSVSQSQASPHHGEEPLPSTRRGVWELLVGAAGATASGAGGNRASSASGMSRQRHAGASARAGGSPLSSFRQRRASQSMSLAAIAAGSASAGGSGLASPAGDIMARAADASNSGLGLVQGPTAARAAARTLAEELEAAWIVAGPDGGISPTTPHAVKLPAEQLYVTADSEAAETFGDRSSYPAGAGGYAGTQAVGTAAVDTLSATATQEVDTADGDLLGSTAGAAAASPRPAASLSYAHSRRAHTSVSATAYGGHGGPSKRQLTVFRGLRVRMGIHSVSSSTGSGEVEVSRNAASGRVQYSGALLRLAKAVSDVGQGGMILMSQATRDALQQATEGESAAALQKALGGPFVVLWMGRHTFTNGAGDAHLYQIVSMPLIGRLALQLQQPGRTLLRKCSPVPPLGGVLDAPAAGLGTLARISVVGASTLMAWNAEVTSRALAQMHEMLLEELRCAVEAAAFDGGGGANGGLTSQLSGHGMVEGSSSYAVALVAGSSTGVVRACVVEGAERLMTAPSSQTMQRHPSVFWSSAGINRPNLPHTAHGASRQAAEQSITPAGDAGVTRWWPRWSHGQHTRNQHAAFKGSASSFRDASGSAKSGTARAREVLETSFRFKDSAPSARSRPTAATMAVAFSGAPATAAQWLLSCMTRLPTLEWPPELLEHPLAEEVVFGSGSGAVLVHMCGLRAAAALAYGDLSGASLVPCCFSGRMSYERTPPAAVLKKAAAAARTGQVVTDAATAAFLPKEISSKLKLLTMESDKLSFAKSMTNLNLSHTP